TTVKPFDKPSVLITTEAFRFSRHPMYLGFVLILLGVGILFGSLSALLPSILMFLTLKVVFISQEEENLEKQFGKTYKSYQRRVRCWI
ncbi:MAG: methyltransferase family protein, partial [Patescibacteria group bacterium]